MKTIYFLKQVKGKMGYVGYLQAMGKIHHSNCTLLLALYVTLMRSGITTLSTVVKLIKSTHDETAAPERWIRECSAEKSQEFLSPENVFTYNTIADTISGTVC